MKFGFILSFVFFFTFKIAQAHEAYVLPHDTFWNVLNGPFNSLAFQAFKNSHNIYISLVIASSVLVLLALNFLFRQTNLGQRVHGFFESFAHLGPQFVRISIALALFFSALSYSFLGPELEVGAFPFASIVRVILFAVSIMIALGLFTEIAAFLGIVVFAYSFHVFGSYVLTYSNYLGELIVLLLFGMRVFSVDKYIFGRLGHLQSFEKYETLIVRVLYGVALIYAGVTVKLLHPELTIEVINDWNLTQFHWLFPSDPLLVTFGAGIVETIIGLFIIFGFEMRLTILISLFYITLSLAYFRELVWPHLLLYGISFNLLVQPETFTLDHIWFKHHRKSKSWWKRIFSPHNSRGKSSL